MRASTASSSSPSPARASIAGRSARRARRRTRTSATTRPPRPREAAGFRPCLRCRPEASPGTPAWSGTSSVVSRALRLIGEGALDRDGVEQLADRLGVTARHLRRLFVQHLGATPIEVALTRRVHFAKKLLDETQLPIAQIAFAAGFGSLRRFNGEMRRTSIRARRRELRKPRAQARRSVRTATASASPTGRPTTGTR